MANATVALQNGFNYQARVFWLNAFDLLIPERRVREVCFEADQPRAFDDVVVHYETAVPRGGSERIAIECHQVKWHVSAGGRFGFADMADPAFIGAARYSLLERLRDAVDGDGSMRSYVLVTTDRIRDDDQLSELVSKNDQSLLMGRLYSSKTDASKMGAVRKCWREHLGLGNDEDLGHVVSRLRIVDGYRSLRELQDEVNRKAVSVGVKPDDEACSSFLYDDLAQKLNGRKRNRFTRERLEQTLREEGLWVGKQPSEGGALSIAIHSFLGLATDLVATAPEHTLFLTDLFRQRYLAEGHNWQADVKPLVEAFLVEMAGKSGTLRLVLNAHASIAYLAGTVYHVKSGVNVELVQKGRVGGARVWRSDDGRPGDPLRIVTEDVGSAPDLAIGLSLTQEVNQHVRGYLSDSGVAVGRFVWATVPKGPGQQSVTGGMHAATLAEQLAHSIRELKHETPNALVHIFAACPNSFLYYLGQQHKGIGPLLIYEFDFDGRGNRSYQPSFRLP